MGSWFDDYRVLECGELSGLRLRRIIGYLVRGDGMMGLSRPRKYAPAHESITYDHLAEGYALREKDIYKKETDMLPPIFGEEEKE